MASHFAPSPSYSTISSPLPSPPSPSLPSPRFLPSVPLPHSLPFPPAHTSPDPSAELDYGLAGARIPEWEGILVVASPSGCARIASLAANRAVAAPAPGSMLLVTVGASFPGSSGWRELPVRVDVATRDGASSMDWAFDQDAEPSFA